MFAALLGGGTVFAQAPEIVAPDDVSMQPADPRARPLDETAIHSAVQQTLRSDPLVEPEAIDAKVGSGGIVQLVGNSRTIVAAERAIELVRTIPGVRDVNSDLVVRPRRDVSGDELEVELRYAFNVDPAINDEDVRIEADDQGHVRLAGKVESSAQRYLMEQVAKSIVGVVNVRNEIELERYVARADRDIEMEVRRVFQWHARVPNQAIEVEVADGTVTLSGAVPSPADVQRAAGLAFVRGVKHVNTVPLETRTSRSEYQGTLYQRQSDEAIASAVRSALAREPRVEARLIEVDVDDRVVTFSGEVQSSLAREAALRTATGVLGVADIRDELQISNTLSADASE